VGSGVALEVTAPSGDVANSGVVTDTGTCVGISSGAGDVSITVGASNSTSLTLSQFSCIETARYVARATLAATNAVRTTFIRDVMGTAVGGEPLCPCTLRVQAGTMQLLI